MEEEMNGVVLASLMPFWDLISSSVKWGEQYQLCYIVLRVLDTIGKLRSIWLALIWDKHLATMFLN